MIGIWLLLLNLSHGIAQESCTLPEVIEEPVLTKPDRINPKRFDSYILAISWSPEYCHFISESGRDKLGQFQCGLNRFGWVVHGLWPQNSQVDKVRDQPRYCQMPSKVPNELIRQMLCTMPQEKLIVDQWNKHGSCSGMQAKEYFLRIQDLWGKIVKPSIQPAKVHSLGEVRALWRQYNPQMSAHSINPIVKNGYLQEVHICLNKDFEFQSCERLQADRGLKVRQ
ncbi:MAG: hypothetical protein QM520_05175 [Gammaproteobacteria bacterium]|nr:hypothetical protein [Gammaproteobacteria bacterium]